MLNFMILIFLQHIKQLSPYDIERKIIDAKPVSNVPEIIVPSHAVYNEKTDYSPDT